MKNIETFESFINESHNMFKLSSEEVNYLWSKIELLKKRKAISTENELFTLLNSNKKSFTSEEFHKILDALEYSFKKRLKDGTIKTELGQSIHKKLPNDWIGIKYSVIKKDK